MTCMPSSPTVLRRLIAVLAGATVLLLGPVATAAQAHDSLESSAPANGASVAAPAAVTLEFGEAPQALGTQVAVTGPNGASVTDGDPAVNGSTVTQPLAADLPAGAYAVEWQVTSDDGHPVSGTFGFTVADGASTSGSTDVSAASAPGDSGTSPLLWIGLGVIVAVAGALLVRQLRRAA
jgi:methionine-rich copper-binding protein CopC